ncbi:MAG: hypothetical protein WCT50_05115 [Patescibacteria group bacterium]
MAGKRKNFYFFITGFFILFGFLFFTHNIHNASAATSTIKGKAYWGQYGYVYFDCADDVVGNRLDESLNFSGGSTYKEPPADAGFHFYFPPCTDNVHGVVLDDNGLLSGKAWNPSFGFISFEHDGVHNPPNYSFNSSHCNQCTSANNCIACYDEANQTVHGWARVESATTSEWLKLDSSAPLPTQLRTGPLNPILTGYNVELGDFAGTAQPFSSTDFGDLSFNCEGETYPTSTCAIRDYKVYIKNLRFGRLSAPNWSYTSACQSTALQAVLRWEKLSGNQSGYEILVRENNDLSTSTGFTCWTGGKVSGTEAVQFIVSNDNPYCQGNGGVKYNEQYYWWIRGYDDNDMPTPWYQYGSNTSADTDQNLDGLADTFETFKHEFPSPFFTWDPLVITVSATGTTFTSNSLAYTTGNPLPQSCDPSRCPFYEWTTTDPDAVIAATNSSSTLINFFNAGSLAISLKVGDAEGYWCSTTTPSFTINYDLPLWHEIKAQ